jgi:hypothetical protein
MRTPKAAAIQIDIEIEIMPTDGTRLPIIVRNDFGTSPYLGSSKPSNALDRAWTLHCFRHPLMSQLGQTLRFYFFFILSASGQRRPSNSAPKSTSACNAPRLRKDRFADAVR